MLKKLIVVLTLCFLVGCTTRRNTSETHDTNRVLDAGKVASQLLRKLNLTDSMEQVSDKVMDSVFMQGEDLTDDKIAYLAIDKGNNTKIAVFLDDDENSFYVLSEHLLKYLDTQKVTIENNYPTEVFKISNAVLEDNGRVVVLVVADNIEDARKYVNDILEK